MLGLKQNCPFSLSLSSLLSLNERTDHLMTKEMDLSNFYSKWTLERTMLYWFLKNGVYFFYFLLSVFFLSPSQTVLSTVRKKRRKQVFLLLPPPLPKYLLGPNSFMLLL